MMMKWVLSGVLTMVCSMLLGRAQAQEGCPCSADGGIAVQSVSMPGVANQPTISAVAAGTVVATAPGQPSVTGRVMSSPTQGAPAAYSYWVASPARTYVSYGAGDQFSFQGRPYGSPGDRWSWYYMGGGNARYLTKYYYPLLP